MTQEIEFKVNGYQCDFMVEYTAELLHGGKPAFELERVAYDSLVLDITDIPKDVAAAINNAIQADVEYVAAFVRAIRSVPKTAGMFYEGLQRFLKGDRKLINENIRKTIFDMKKQISEHPTGMLDAIGEEAYRYFNIQIL